MRFLLAILVFSSAQAHGDDSLLLPDKSRHDCVVAISELQLQELAGDNEDLTPALEMASKSFAKIGFETMRIDHLDRDQVADLTGRALFLNFQGAALTQFSCQSGAKIHGAVSQIALSLNNEIAQGNELAKTWGQPMSASASCSRKLASAEAPSLTQESRMNALANTIKHLPSCEQLQAKHLQGWLF
jgi:hypothetical protein